MLNADPTSPALWAVHRAFALCTTYSVEQEVYDSLWTWRAAMIHPFVR